MRRWGAAGLAARLLAGCGDEPLTVEELIQDAADAIDTAWFEDEEQYGASYSVESLKVPPDLSAPDVSGQLAVPGLEGASAQLSARRRAAPVLPSFLEMKLRREGTVRWLEVGADPVALWPHLRKFWAEQGYELVAERPIQGLLETGWREHLNDLRPAGTAADGATGYYAATREKFRLRVEREPNAYVNVYIARYGLEVAGIDAQRNVVWRAGAADPEREIEMLSRLMEHLGGSRLEGVATLEEEEIEGSVGLDLQYIDGTPVLMVQDGFSSVWRQVGVALDRSGLFVLRQDRGAGTYVVRYRGPAAVGAGDDGLLLEVHLLGRSERMTLVTAHYHDSDAPLTRGLTREVLQHVVAAYALLPRYREQEEAEAAPGGGAR